MPSFAIITFEFPHNMKLGALLSLPGFSEVWPIYEVIEVHDPFTVVISQKTDRKNL